MAQPSQLYRRGIVLPLDQEAEDGLRAEHPDEGANVRLLSIPDDDQLYESLVRLGLFDEINARCASLVDDYEEELIEPDAVDGVVQAIDAASESDLADSQVIEFLRELRDMAREAAASSRPLLFVL